MKRLTRPGPTPPMLRRRSSPLLVVCGLIGSTLALFSVPASAVDCAYVGNQLIGTVRVLSVPDGREVSSTVLPACGPLCQLTDIVVEPESRTAYLTQFDGSLLWAVDTDAPEGSAEPLSIAVAGAPTDLALAADASRLYAITFQTSEVVSIDLDPLAEIGRFAAPSQPRGLDLTPNGSNLVTTSRNQNKVFVLTVSNGATAEMGDVGVRPVAVALTPDGTRALVAGEENSLTVIDVATGATVDAFVTGELPAAVAVAADGQTVYVANRGDDTVSVIDLPTRDITSVDVGNFPVALALTAEGHLLVANFQGSSLSVIDTTDNNAVLAPIPAGASPYALTAAPCPETTEPTPSGTPVDTPAEPTPSGTAVETATATPTGGCAGDCNDDGSVAINELITGVNISLGQRDISACPAFDTSANGSVEIAELIRAVRNSLDGCPA